MRGFSVTRWKAILIVGLVLAASAAAQNAFAQPRYSTEVFQDEGTRLSREGRQILSMVQIARRQQCVSREGIEGYRQTLARWNEQREFLANAFYKQFPPGSGVFYLGLIELADLWGDIEKVISRLRPCPERVQGAAADFLGSYFGIDFVKNWGWQNIKEFDAFSGRPTNNIVEIKDPPGVGLAVGYNFALNNGLIVGPYASFDFLTMSINRTFPGGTFIGSTMHWFATAGAKVGTMVGPGVFFYGLGGVSVLNHDLNINFGGPATSDKKTTPGGTAGFGAEFRPSMLQGFGLPVSVFFQYQHTWWADAHLDRPVASPFFNYTYKREDDTIKLGLNFYFSAPPPPAQPARPMYTKAPPLK